MGNFWSFIPAFYSSSKFENICDNENEVIEDENAIKDEVVSEKIDNESYSAIKFENGDCHVKKKVAFKLDESSSWSCIKNRNTPLNDSKIEKSSTTKMANTKTNQESQVLNCRSAKSVKECSLNQKEAVKLAKHELIVSKSEIKPKKSCLKKNIFTNFSENIKPGPILAESENLIDGISTGKELRKRTSKVRFESFPKVNLKSKDSTGVSYRAKTSRQRENAKWKSLLYSYEYIEYNGNDKKLRMAKQMDMNMGLIDFLPKLPKNLRKSLVINWTENGNNFFHQFQKIQTLEANTEPIGIITGGVNPLDAKDYKLGGSISAYDPVTNIWKYYGLMPEPRNCHTSVYLQGGLYIIGGYSPFLRENGEMLATPTTYCLNLKLNKWYRCKDMQQTRACHAVGVINEIIYVLGGRNNLGQILSTMESYHYKIDRWYSYDILPKPIMSCGFACDGINIWLIGGITLDKKEQCTKFLKTVYKLDVKKNRFSELLDLQETRAFCSAIYHDRGIWVSGGCTWKNGQMQSLAAIDFYSIENNNWEQRFFLEIPKHSVTMLRVGKKLVILGGMSSEISKPTDSVDVVDNFDFIKALPFFKPIVGGSGIEIPNLY